MARGTATRPRPWPRVLAGLMPRGRRALLPAPAGTGEGTAFDLGAASVPVEEADNPRVLGTGERAFPRIIERIAAARRSVVIRAFLWRDDEAGNIIASALLEAADRGVQVTIQKDRIAAVYEYTGGNKQSFFHKRVDPV